MPLLFAAIGFWISGVPEPIFFGAATVIASFVHVIRPRFVRGEAKVPTLVTFAALLGGVEVLGLKGLPIGPVVMALALAVLRLYAAETRERRHRCE